jgi:hypothetical protein
MPIYCQQCKKQHNIKPQTPQEETLMRVVLSGHLTKTYFCDLSCFYRYRQKYHPDGYYAKTKMQIMYDHDLQTMQNHSHWKPVPWLEDVYKKAISVEGGYSDLIELPHNEEIVEDAKEQARMDEMERRRRARVQKQCNHEVRNQYEYYDDHFQQRQFTV